MSAETLAPTAGGRARKAGASRLGLSWRVRMARILLLGLTDAAALATSVTLAAVFWGVRVRAQTLDLYVELWPLLALFLVAYAMAGLYPGHSSGLWSSGTRSGRRERTGRLGSTFPNL